MFQLDMHKVLFSYQTLEILIEDSLQLFTLSKNKSTGKLW